MKYWIVVVFPALTLAACGNGAPPAAPPAQPDAESASAEVPENAMDMTNIEMHLWPSSEAPGQEEKPLLSIRAQRVTGNMDGSGAELSFEGAQAVVPQQKPEDSQIHFEAASGTFQENQRAVLKGGVKAQIDDMAIALEEITWEIAPREGEDSGTGMAFSDKPLTITSPTQKLEAARLRLYPDSNSMELYEVSGVITFTGEKP
ncbi:MAG: LPS export ABC transporter periplasmic protein LptC [Candidatus Hydrogenedentes bacterium]|nr:LPS export ABC transporter periplasmic protein LptC [Candidatus Hydrogenedentota bacterium]